MPDALGGARRRHRTGLLIERFFRTRVMKHASKYLVVWWEGASEGKATVSRRCLIVSSDGGDLTCGPSETRRPLTRASPSPGRHRACWKGGGGRAGRTWPTDPGTSARALPDPGSALDRRLRWRSTFRRAGAAVQRRARRIACEAPSPGGQQHLGLDHESGPIQPWAAACDPHTVGEQRQCRAATSRLVPPYG